MIDTILRVNGPNFEVKKFLENTDLKIIKFWEKGTHSEITKKYILESGFNYEICKTKQCSKMLFEKHKNQIIKFITNGRKTIDLLRKLGAESIEIDIGVFKKVDFMFSLGFQRDILKILSKENISLYVTFYPD